MSYECSDEGNIPNSSTHSHPSEAENLEIAATFASVNGPLDVYVNKL